MLGAGDSEARVQRQRRGRAGPSHESGQGGGELIARPGRPGHAHQVEPAVAAGCAESDPLFAGGRGHQLDPGQLRTLLHRKVDDDGAAGAGGGRVGGEALVAVGLEDCRVGHGDERRLHQGAGGRDAFEAGRGAHAAGERALGGEPDRRPLREGIREGDPELDHVGATLDRRPGQLGGLRLADQIDDERGHRRESTVAKVLVAPARQADEHELGVDVERAGKRVRALQRGDDSFGARQGVERVERLGVGAGEVVGAAGVAQSRVLGADTGVVETRRDRMRVGDLAVVVGEDRRACAVQDGGAPAAEAGRARRLDPDQADVGVIEEGDEAADGVGAAAHAGDDRVREPALGLEQLLAGLVADHALEGAHDLGVGRGPHARPDQVVAGLDVCDPVANRLAGRLLERPGAELDWHHLGAEEPHPLDVGRLAVHVLGRPCTRRTRARTGRTRSPPRLRAVRRRSRPRSAACRAGWRAAPDPGRC